LKIEINGVKLPEVYPQVERLARSILAGIVVPLTRQRGQCMCTVMF